jgi:hypothetical protein
MGQPEEVRFTGVVQAIGLDEWTVASQVLVINDETEIRDNPQIGQLVEVRALRAANGTLTALRIELEEDDGENGTAEPGGGSPSAPTSTSAPGATDDDNSGPSPSNTPEPEETDEAEETEEPDDDEGENEEIRWEGTLESTGAVWVIGGQSVTVTGGTEINDGPQVGDNVEVRAVEQPDGSLWAVRIDKK